MLKDFVEQILNLMTESLTTRSISSRINSSYIFIQNLWKKTLNMIFKFLSRYFGQMMQCVHFSTKNCTQTPGLQDNDQFVAMLNAASSIMGNSCPILSAVACDQANWRAIIGYAGCNNTAADKCLMDFGMELEHIKDNDTLMCRLVLCLYRMYSHQSCSSLIWVILVSIYCVVISKVLKLCSMKEKIMTTGLISFG